MRRTFPILLMLAIAATGCAAGQVDDTQTLPAPSDTPPKQAATPQPSADEPPPPPPEAPTLRLANTVLPEEYRAELTIDANADAFSGVIDIEINLLERMSDLWLNATDIEVTAAHLSARGQRWDIQRLPTSNNDFLGFALGFTLPAGKATLHIEYKGKLPDKEGSGLFRREDKENWYVYSHMEPLSARRVFPSFDEPRFKVPWQLTIHTPDTQVAFANTPLVEEKPGPAAGTKTFRFAQSKPLPSYLVALAVGPFETVDVGQIGRNKTPTRIIVPKGRTAEARYAVETTPRLLTALENYFDMPYPYAKLDSIAVPGFGGAMENPGLITYNIGLLLSPPDNESLQFKRGYASVGAHELAHQWFGNLVTLDWWDDIWLNESFATWLAIKVVAEIEPGWNNEIDRVREIEHAVSSDSSAKSSAIHRTIETRDDIEMAFDGISYQKGGAVLGMFERWVGEDKFRDGIRTYMRRHAWGTATSKDFLTALGEVSTKDVPSAFATFLEQPGAPLLNAALSCTAGKSPTLELSQERLLPAGSKGENSQTWKIPVCVKYGRGQKVAEQCELMAAKSMALQLDKLGACPDWVMPNAGAAGYYRVAYADGMLKKLFTQGAKHLSSAEQVTIVGDMSALVSSGKISLGEALAQVPTLLRNNDPNVVRRAAVVVAGVSREMIPEKLEPNYRRFVNRMFRARARQLGWDAKKGDSDEIKMLRSTLLGMVAGRAEDPVLIEQAKKKARMWLDKRSGVDADMLDDILILAGRHDAKLYQRFAEALEKSEDHTERRALISGMAGTRDPKQLTANLTIALSGKYGLRETATFIWLPLSRPDTRQVIYDQIKQNYDQILEKLPRMAHRFVLSVPAAFCDQEHYDDAKAFFGPKAEKLPGGTIVFERTLERMELCMAYRAAQKASVEAFLAKY